jgi:hypothetical protein
MEGESQYQTFLSLLQQFAQDQTFYESDLLNSEELDGKEHEDIIKLGGVMSKRLQKFAEKGEGFAETLPNDFLPKLMDAIQSYQLLIVPPKPFGGFCPCLKPARSGVEYEKKMLVTKAKMVSVIFISYAVIIENKGEQHNMDSMHYADYCNKMNNVFSQLNEVKLMNSNVSEKGLEANRKKLLACTESVDKFILHFGESGGSEEFKTVAQRRIRAAQESLAQQRQNANAKDNPGAINTARRQLINVQASLQEVMNSAAAISAEQAKVNLDSLDNLTKILKKSRDVEVNQFNEMEEKMVEYVLMDVLHRLREDSEVIHSDASSKLRDSIKRWESVKKQSQPRKVAEYIEEPEPTMIAVPGMENMKVKVNMNPAGLNGNDISAAVDPREIFKHGKMASMQVKTFADKAGTKVVSDINSFVKATNEALNIKGLGANDAPPAGPPPPVPTKKTAAAASNGNSGGFNLNSLNPLEAVTAKPTPPPKPQKQQAAASSAFVSPMDALFANIGGDSAEKTTTKDKKTYSLLS